MKKVINFIRNIPGAVFHLLTFKTYTFYPRWYEIIYGIIAWVCILEIVYINLIK